jgi:hypothetical protein
LSLTGTVYNVAYNTAALARSKAVDKVMAGSTGKHTLGLDFHYSNEATWVRRAGAKWFTKSPPLHLCPKRIHSNNI